MNSIDVQSAEILILTLTLDSSNFVSVMCPSRLQVVGGWSAPACKRERASRRAARREQQQWAPPVIVLLFDEDALLGTASGSPSDTCAEARPRQTPGAPEW